MKSIGLLLLLFTYVSLSGCKSLQQSPHAIPENTPSVIVDPSIDLKARSSPVSITFAEQVGDFLAISVSYSGGCEDHEFRLVSKGKFTATYPPEVEIALKHDDKGDMCRSKIDEKRYFDLSPLKYQGTNQIILVLTNTNRIIHYTY